MVSRYVWFGDCSDGGAHLRALWRADCQGPASDTDSAPRMGAPRPQAHLDNVDTVDNVDDVDSVDAVGDVDMVDIIRNAGEESARMTLKQAIGVVNKTRRRTSDPALVIGATCNDCGEEFAMLPQDHSRADVQGLPKLCRLCAVERRREARRVRR